MNERDEYLTVEQRAEEEHRTVASIHQEQHRGLGPPGYRIGKRVLYRRSETEQWRRSHAIWDALTVEEDA